MMIGGVYGRSGWPAGDWGVNPSAREIIKMCVNFNPIVSTSFKYIEVWGPFTSEQTLFGARFLEGLRGGSPCAPVATPDLKYVAGWCFRLFRLSYGALGRYSGELSRPKGRGDRSESD